MKKYIVTFEFQNGLGEWIADCKTNNGAGFTEEDARYVAWQIEGAYNPTRYVEVREFTNDEIAEVEVVTEFIGYDEEGRPVFETVERVPEAN